MVRELRLVSADQIRPTAPPARLARDPRRRYPGDGQTADGSVRSALLEALSREMRTTLALVSGYSQTLLHLDLDDEERGRCLARISVASEHVAQLTEEMLSVTASTNDGRPLCQAVAIGSLLSQLGRQLTEEADPPRLIAQLPADLPLVSADPVWIGNVLRILVTTVAAGSARGSAVRIGARSNGECVVVTAQPGEELRRNEAPIRVSPMAPRSPRLEPPESVTACAGRTDSLNHQPGLDFCRELVEAHGGRIWLDETAFGVRVSFSLPRYWPEATPVEGRGRHGLAGVLRP
jgi:signal transduction histidine kinase